MHRPVPVLVSMEGEKEQICELLGMERTDTRYIKRYLSPEEVLYLNSKYPEYMGAIPVIIAKIASAAVGVGKAIAGAVKKKREAKKSDNDRKQAEANALIQQYQYQQQMLYAQQQKKKQDTNLMLMIGIPTALILFMMSRR